MKDRLLPSFCTLSAFRSIALFWVGMAGSGGLCIAGLAILLIGTDDIPSLNRRSFGLAWQGFRLLCCGGKAENPVLEPLGFPDAFCTFSICPRTVVPLQARSSSGMRVKRTTPRMGATPKESAK